MIAVGGDGTLNEVKPFAFTLYSCCSLVPIVFALYSE